ncbi:DUF1995 family protein [Prochlorococcus marinus]|uniref:DUF1995 domain-containing protein n=1 Tax=Prochlorococcus marinus (strain MIT 9211) TaxID=93059 RepID=A9BAE7_PROM4|nr:DUF1995 family protein [Prochlorococcus marinus]ABX08809.1 conserved hypothetical protein [Prochlorococcus marinus str. MIT 9211]
MIKDLPFDLKEAELQLFESLSKSFISKKSSRLSVDLLFEGLKITPIVFRTARKFIESGTDIKILFSDFGSCALAQRDYPEFKDSIYTFKDYIGSDQLTNIETALFVVSPEPYDFDQFSLLAEKTNLLIVMFNGRLEDTAVGIGSVGRDRRTKFISSWSKSYMLQPLSKGALMYHSDVGWQLFKYTNIGYRKIKTYNIRPDEDIINIDLLEL